MKTVTILLFVMLTTQWGAGWMSGQEKKLVHNTFSEIEACKGKLKLELVRTWGGDKEEDENKFFKEPYSMLIGKDESVYICDRISHHVKIYGKNTNHLRNVGQRGKGPGDLYGPLHMAWTPDGNFWVAEMGGRRLQCFNPSGKSKSIFKTKHTIEWVGVTSKNEVVTHSRWRSFYTKKLLGVHNKKGKIIREMGVYHDKSNSWMKLEGLVFSLDHNDQFYAANVRVPVIRKYSPEGTLLQVITFETPTKTPPPVVLNTTGDEIIRLDKAHKEKTKVEGKGKGGVAIQFDEEKVDEALKFRGVLAMGLDSRGNIYVAANRRLLTERESKATAVSGNLDMIDRSLVDFDAIENIDAQYLLVFNPAGKIIAEAQLFNFCDFIYIHNDRIFIGDGGYNQRILEYRMTIDNT